MRPSSWAVHRLSFDLSFKIKRLNSVNLPSRSFSLRSPFLRGASNEPKQRRRHEQSVDRWPRQFAGLRQIVGNIGVITLKNPAKRNALCHEMMHALSETFTHFAEAEVRVAILRADPGVKVWSAGHDIGELPLGDIDPLRYADPMEETLRAIRMFPGPVIAMVHGAVWGGAFDLVFSCDIVFADETATFAITPVISACPITRPGFSISWAGSDLTS